MIFAELCRAAFFPAYVVWTGSVLIFCACRFVFRIKKLFGKDFLLNPTIEG